MAEIQRKIYKILKAGKQLCSKDVSKLFEIRRQSATQKLVKLEKSMDDVSSTYRQIRVGPNVYSVKYYKI